MADQIKRSCGECQLCCEVLEVDGLKQANQKCQHQCASGCAIYELRPDACKQYSCSWLEGHGSDDDRPDKIGMFAETLWLGPRERTQVNAEFVLLVAFDVSSDKYGKGLSRDKVVEISERFVRPGVAVAWMDYSIIASDSDADEIKANVAMHKMLNEPIIMADGEYTIVDGKKVKVSNHTDT